MKRYRCLLAKKLSVTPIQYGYFLYCSEDRLILHLTEKREERTTFEERLFYAPTLQASLLSLLRTAVSTLTSPRILPEILEDNLPIDGAD
ncbi:MAG: hypothetical protein IKC59_05870 [Clostridia bacterium]|nr:hypothetical protein [Clostridia bacterium]